MNRWSLLLAGFFSLAATCTLSGQDKDPNPRFESPGPAHLGGELSLLS